MEEVMGLLVDALAKRARGNATPALKPKPKVPIKPPARPTTAAPPVAPPAAPAPVAPRAVRPAPPAPPPEDDPFAAVLRPPPPHVAATGLLSAFGGRNQLLAAFVLAEALAPPVALRENSLELPRVEEG